MRKKLGGGARSKSSIDTQKHEWTCTECGLWTIKQPPRPETDIRTVVYVIIFSISHTNPKNKEIKHPLIRTAHHTESIISPAPRNFPRVISGNFLCFSIQVNAELNAIQVTDPVIQNHSSGEILEFQDYSLKLAHQLDRWWTIIYNLGWRGNRKTIETSLIFYTSINNGTCIITTN